MVATIEQCIVPAPRARWNAIYSGDPTALPDQSPFWLDHVCALKRCTDASRYYRLNTGQELVLPMVALRGRRLASLPYSWGMGGVLSETALDAAAIKAVFDDLAAIDALQVGVWPNPLQGALWAEAAPPTALIRARRAEILDLSGGFDTVWRERIASRTRNYFNRAEKAGLRIVKGNRPELVAVFYGLYEKSILRWAEQTNEPQWLARWRLHRMDPMEKLQKMATMLADRCAIWIAYSGDAPAAGIVVIQDTNANYLRGAMDRDLAGPTHANEYLHLLAIRAACEAGCHYYQMGESGVDGTALSHFKQRFGAVSYDYADYVIERLPLRKTDLALRRTVKRLIGYRGE